MHNFKEWLSDYLRYFLLLLAALLAFALIMIGVRVYQSVRQPEAKEVIEILTEAESSKGQTEAQSESTEETATEGQTDRTDRTAAEVQNGVKNSPAAPNAGTQTEKVGGAAGTNTGAAGIQNSKTPTRESETSKNSAAQKPETKAPATQKAGTSAETNPQTETEPKTEAPTETEPPTEPAPVYKTLKGSCYIRSGPSMDAEIIGEYMYGTTVEVLEDVGGWYKVQIDGMVGYMGARFF